jgi:hypothetical protein
LGINNISSLREYCSDSNSDEIYKDIIRLGLYNVNHRLTLLKAIVTYMFFLIFFVNIHDLTLYKTEKKPLSSKLYHYIRNFDLAFLRKKKKAEYTLGNLLE